MNVTLKCYFTPGQSARNPLAHEPTATSLPSHLRSVSKSSATIHRQSSFGMVIPPSEIVIRRIEKIEIKANISAFTQLSSECFYL